MPVFSTRCGVRSRAMVVAGLLLSAAVFQAAQAEPLRDSAETSPAQSGQPVAEGLGNFFGKIGQTLSSFGGGKRDKLQFDDLKAGTYEKSNEAIGEAKDIDEKRITHGLLVLPSFTQYADGVLNKLKLASGVEQIPGKILIAANDQLDAGSTPDGNIFISSGYIRDIKSEDQLAALLAHELSHVLLRHHDTNVIGRIQKQASGLLIYGVAMRNTLQTATGGVAANLLSPSEKDALMKLELLIALNDMGLQPAWGRRQEAEADRLGMDLMIKAGYSYAGMLDWLEMVAQWDKKQADIKATDTKSKQDAVQTLMASGKFDESLKQGIDTALNGLVAQFSNAHDDGEKRLEDIDGYFVSAYKEKAPQVALQTTALKIAKEKPDVRGVMNGYQTVFGARNSVRNLKFDDAIKALSPLVDRSTPLSNEALPNQLMFEAYRAKGRQKEAERYLNKSLVTTNPVWDVYDSAAQYFKDKGDLNQVQKVGKVAFDRFSGAPSAYPKLIALYRNAGLVQAKEAVLADCILKQADRRDQCVEASKSK